MGDSAGKRLDIIEMEKKGIGQVIANRYTLSAELGNGGMGKIYLASDQQLSRQVAIKTIHQKFRGNEDLRERVARECRLHAKLGIHQNIVALYDRIDQGEDIYLVMEYVDGINLVDRLENDPEKKGRFSTSEVVELVLQLLKAVSHIHAHGIVHRDIKPSNIMLLDKETPFAVKLLDLGIADSGNNDDTGGPGTPAYMAPERIDPETFGEESAVSDLYSVGVILYELLAGSPPFQGKVTEIFTGHLAGEPNLKVFPETVPEPLLDVVKISLEKDQKNRFQTARDFIAALEQTRQTISPPVRDTTESGWEHTLLATKDHIDAIKAANIQAKRKRKGKKFLFLSGIGVMLLLGFAGGSFYYYQEKIVGTSSPKEQIVANPLENTDHEIEEKKSSVDNQAETIDKKTFGQYAASSPKVPWSPIESADSSGKVLSGGDAKGLDNKMKAFRAEGYVASPTKEPEQSDALLVFKSLRESRQDVKKKKRPGKKENKPAKAVAPARNYQSSKKSSSGWKKINDVTIKK